MEDEKYNLGKVREEAKEIQQEVESNEINEKEIVKKRVENYLHNYLAELSASHVEVILDDYLQNIRALKQRFNISTEEIEGSPAWQKTLKEIALDDLRHGRLYIFKKLGSDMLISDEVNFLPEFQEAARESIKNRLFDYLNELDKKNFGFSDENLQIIRLLQQRFNIPAGEMEADSELQEEARKIMFDKLKLRHIDTFEHIKINFFVSNETYNTLPKFQEAAKITLEEEIKNYLRYGLDSGWDNKPDIILRIKQDFKFDNEIFEKLLRVAVLKNLEYLEQGTDTNFLVLINRIGFLPPDFFSQPEVSNILIKALVKKLNKGEIEWVVKNTELIELPTNIYTAVDIEISTSEKLAHNLIKFIKYLGDENIINKFPKTFERIKELILAKLATDQDLADYFIENLNLYFQQPWVAENVAKAIQHFSVAQKFIDAVNKQAVWSNESWVADILQKTKVAEHQAAIDQVLEEGDNSSYYNNQGFKESNPYENHTWRFGGQQIKVASAISRLMTGDINIPELEELGIKREKIASMIQEVNEKVNTAYQNFLEQISYNSNIKNEDKEALLNPELCPVKMILLLNNVRNFVARIIVQFADGNVLKLEEVLTFLTVQDSTEGGNFSKILAEGFRRYIKIHEVDVPLYDKLYEEFDTL